MTSEEPSATQTGAWPEILLALRLVAPQRAEAIKEYVEALHARRAQRMREFGEEVLESSELEPDDVWRLVSSNELLQDLFQRAVSGVIDSSFSQKRKGLARVVASGLLSRDNAAIDEAQLVVEVIRLLGPTHLRVLLAIEEWEASSGYHEPRDPQTLAGCIPAELYARVAGDHDAVDSIASYLVGIGLLRDDNVRATFAQEHANRYRMVLTGFGRRVLGFLREPA